METPDVAQIVEINSWLSTLFDAAGVPVPDFDYTPESVAHLHALASLSRSRTRAAEILASDGRRKAREYSAQAVRIREVLDFIGLAYESLSPKVTTSARDLASVSNMLELRDTDMSSFLVAMGDISLKRVDLEDKRRETEKESKLLLQLTRKAITRLVDLKGTLSAFEEEITGHEAQKSHKKWQTNLEIMELKQRQYAIESENYKALLSRGGYSPDIDHSNLVDMLQHKIELERMTKPVLDTLRGYRNLPPDKALASLAIEQKRREYEAAAKRLEDLVQALDMRE
ncbi:hypothetical protein H6P81_001521 [Aristolochia fimbriata]|uniref:HAUS augmin-like complex subunit 1 n=1 Tax=Aristolochia fimbriata TaxID=158543 RepID=A0AAV7F7E7_ARIFI|nr:hypothetical protein H6P81_001521 [Aristolochia fimbriata]